MHLPTSSAAVEKLSATAVNLYRGQVIAGSVFVFNPQEAEIKRWKDDLLWSLARQLGNFQIYREIEEPQTRHPEIMIKADGLVKKDKYKSTINIAPN
ncbi:hypothetical protein C8R44DRAFT_877820 [Mycena epipterygia]|nr:hypothetical protein C8R44DRAFT_877820 [Mycena epipterygia]